MTLNQFPQLEQLANEECTICILENTSSDTIKVASIEKGVSHLFNERRYTVGNPNPYPALGGCDFGIIKYNITIPPKRHHSFPVGSIMSRTEKYDKIEFEIRFFKKDIEYSQWIGCP